MSQEIRNWIQTHLAPQITGQTFLPAQAGEWESIPNQIHPSLYQVLHKSGIEKLYRHQLRAFEEVSQGRSTLIASRTSTGKTLSFLLPILNDYLNSPEKFTVLLLYPTKALSRDQEGTLGQLLGQLLEEKHLGTFDGDTPREERARLESSGHFIISNPDMLHSGILPNHHRKWKNFLAGLKYVVVDEVHIYRGAFGSHVANVFTRLERICTFHGSHPTYIAASATMGNPVELAEKLFNRSFTLVEGTTAPSPPRHVYTLNPDTYTTESGNQVRKGPASLALPLVKEAIHQKVRTIIFCQGRQEAERFYTALISAHPSLATQTAPYRGGLLPLERRELEKRLFQGQLLGIISTSALELGIDIGDLDLCIQLGYPGSLSSLWQRAGRVGRRGQASTLVLIGREAPLDQYIMHQNHYLFQTPLEKAWINPANPYILIQHLACAAGELPLSPQDSHYPQPFLSSALKVLEEQKSITLIKGLYHYTLPDYPTRGIHLRGINHTNVDIICNDEVIGEIDPVGARGTLYKDAIYQHLGKKYISLDLNLDQKICKVAPVSVHYFTEAVWEHRTELLHSHKNYELNAHGITFGSIKVSTQPKLYKKIREHTFENVGYGLITLDPFIYNTLGFALVPAEEFRTWFVGLEKHYMQAALLGLAHLLKKVAPSFCLADPADTDTDIASFAPHDQAQSALFFHDTLEGGAGYAEKVFDALHGCLTLCQRILQDCSCKFGCPACIPSLPKGAVSEELMTYLVCSNASVACTQSFLAHLLEGIFIEPQIRVHKEFYPRSPSKILPEQIRLENQLLQGHVNLLEKKHKPHI